MQIFTVPLICEVVVLNAEDMHIFWQVIEYRRARYKKALSRSPDIKGPGEDGEPVHLTAEEQAEADKLFAKETFNVIASNKVALDRRIRDNRHPEYVDVNCMISLSWKV